MDHLPQPSKQASVLGKFPFVAHPRFHYDGRGYEDYKGFPRYHGFDFKSEPRKGRMRDQSVKDRAAFIQSWLYFGFLSELTQTDIDTSKFKRTEVSEDGTKKSYLNSAPLKDLKLKLRKLKYDGNDGRDEIDPADKGMHNRDDWEERRINQLLHYTDRQCSNLDTMKGWTSEEPIPLILLSIRVLMDTVAMVCIGFEPQNVMPLGENLPESAVTVSAVKQLMLYNGWCPFQIKFILRSFHTPMVCYLAQLQRRVRAGITHKNCSPDTCVAFNIDPLTYKTRHLTNDCLCDFITIPASQMRDIVAQGGIPLAFVKRDKNGLSLGVKAATHSDSYVAFSHVWSDGLGNISGNAIPTCQLKKLDEYMRNCKPLNQSVGAGFYGSLDMIKLSKGYKADYFWLDTLCIPASLDDDDQEYKRLKRKAINNIAPTFAGANRVIILDWELKENFQLNSADWTEITARLIFSSWVGRCWTLEEGALSRACQLECIDASFDINEVTQESSLSRYLTSKRNYAQILGEILKISWDLTQKKIMHKIRPVSSYQAEHARVFQLRARRMIDSMLEQSMSEAFFRERKESTFSDEAYKYRELMIHFRNCWNNLGRRQTSRSEDRLMILSNLLDLNAFKIASSPAPMTSLLLGLPGVPLSLLYNPENNLKIEQNQKEVPYTESEATSNDYNRWLPLYPGTYQLPDWDFMKWKDEFLVLPHAAEYITQIFLVDDINSIMTSDNTAELLIEPRNERRSSYVATITFIRHGREPLPKVNDEQQICFLVDRDDKRRSYRDEGDIELRGACLLATEVIKDQKTRRHRPRHISDVVGGPVPGIPGPPALVHITAVFDCAVSVRLRPLDDGSLEREVIDSIRKSFAGKTAQGIPYWTLKMRHDCPKSAQIPPRVRAIEFFLFNLTTCAVMIMPCLIVNNWAMIKFIGITRRTFRILPLIPKIAMGVWWTGHIVGTFSDWTTYWDIMELATTTLYWQARTHFGPPLSSPERSFIGMELVGHAVCLALLSLYKRYIAPQVFQEWLSSFRPISPSTDELIWSKRVPKVLAVADGVLNALFGKVLEFVSGVVDRYILGEDEEEDEECERPRPKIPRIHKGAKIGAPGSELNRELAGC